jgi:hypothetical protein
MSDFCLRFSLPEGLPDSSLARSAGKRPKRDPSRRERYDRRLLCPGRVILEKLDSHLVEGLRFDPDTGYQPGHTVPYGTDHHLPQIQALRDRLPSCSPSWTQRSEARLKTSGLLP